MVGSRGGWQTRLGDWRLTVTEASAPFYDDYAADTSTTGTVSVGGSVSGVIDSTPVWYNAGDTGGPDGYSSHEPGYTGAYSGYSCHRETGDGIALDGTPATVTGSKSRSPLIGPTSWNWRAGRMC